VDGVRLAERIYLKDDSQRILERLLTDPAGLTVREIVGHWPTGTQPPSPWSLRERQWELVALELLEWTGRGARFVPYRYRMAVAQGVSLCHEITS